MYRRIAALILSIASSYCAAQATPYIDIRNYGAVGNGTTNNCTAFTNAAAACVNATMLIPAGTFATSCTITLPISCSIEGINNAASIIQISASTTGAVITQGDGSDIAQNQKIEGVTIDAKGLANDGIFLRQFHGYTLRDVTVNNALVNSFHLGDSTISGSYAAYIWNSTAYRASGVAIPVASIGVFIDNSTDNQVIGSTVIGSNTGIRVNTSGNILTNNHVWAFGPAWMTIGFDDNGLNNFWDADEADTVETYGLIVRQTGARTMIRGGRFYNNGSGQDNVAVGIKFSAASPIATVSNNIFSGNDPTHRLAQDIVASDFTNVTLLGNQAYNTVIYASGFVSAASSHFKNPVAGGNSPTTVVIDSGTTSSYTACLTYDDNAAVRFSFCKSPEDNLQMYDYAPGGSPGSLPRWYVNHYANMQFFAGSTAASSTFDFLDGTQTLRAQIGQFGMYKSGRSANSDIAGELSFSAATTASYTFQDTYTSHPECWLQPQFNQGTNNPYWVTYSGVASFTAHFTTAVTGTLSYACAGRN